ncbi:hypothetical protein [Pseudomonas sp. Sample_22]|uniref:hypothetical protein n=1 Tax=Pseudomonas sp. Sample_22 TaxID=2448266 RepID=UPI001032B4F2|nr:hypothetical protein [Pseudomonas sp. Sample_22]
MAHLTDMEELLATIPTADIRDYMREAMSCYMAGAYRGSVVLSYIALFDDLLAKLSELARVNAGAKVVFDEASKKKSDQDVFENFLIDQLTSKALLSGLDGAFLTTLRILRNKSAHPSGHKPSAEEARFIFYETINRFLSRPILSTTQLVDEIISRLANSNFFPNQDITEIKNIVATETANLHAEALPQLVAKLTTSVLSADNNIAANAIRFLLGLARDSDVNTTKAIASKVIESKADDPAYGDLVVQLLSANGKLFINLTPVCVGRVRAIISSRIDSVTSAVSESKLIHPANALASIAREISGEDLIKNYGAELEKLIEKRPYSQHTIKLVSDNKDKLIPIYFPILLANAGSSTYDTANSFANIVDSLDIGLSKALSPEQCFQLITATSNAANWGAWSSAALESAKYSSIPGIRAKAIDHINSNTSSTEAYLIEKLNFHESAEKFIESYLTNK